MKNIKAGKMQRAFEIDTDVLYQWKDFPTYETRITPIHDIHMKNVTCEEVDAIYEIKGDERLPVENVELKNIHVNKVNKFIKKVSNAKNVNEKSVTYTKLAGQ